MKKLWNFLGMGLLVFAAPFATAVFVNMVAMLFGVSETPLFSSLFAAAVYPTLIFFATVLMRSIAGKTKNYRSAYVLFGIGIAWGMFQWCLGVRMGVESFVLTGHVMNIIIYAGGWRKLRKHEKREREQAEAAPASPVVTADGEVIEWPKQCNPKQPN